MSVFKVSLFFHTYQTSLLSYLISSNPKTLFLTHFSHTLPSSLPRSLLPKHTNMTTESSPPLPLDVRQALHRPAAGAGNPTGHSHPHTPLRPLSHTPTFNFS
ncbi:hypothetical protein HanRHA438_Chr03g0113521 [Helianthus annuus]|nr:hypothetical protein HanRHA438_Chr03g0113521 [Helianthus annuus]